MSALRTIDLRWFGVDYRIAEPLRSQGAEIRPAGDATGCFTCDHRFRPQTKTYRAPSGRSYCLSCAVDNDALIQLVAVDDDQQAELAEQRAGVGR